jgi:protein-tyrosine-phosphatase/peptidoglycan/xylan/chitin deacetylase (PgdA/CDA1 family)
VQGFGVLRRSADNNHVKTFLKSLFKAGLVRTLTLPPIAAVGERLFAGRVTVFYMHRVAASDRENHGRSEVFLRRTISYLKKHGYRFINVGQLVDGSIDLSRARKTIAFTLDDGFQDQADVAGGVFTEYGCRPTIFLVSGFIDGQLWPWDDKVAYAVTRCQRPRISLELAGHRRAYELDSKERRFRAIVGLQASFKSLPASELDAALNALAEATGVDIPDKPPAGYRPMSWEQARALERQGVRFAPHTVTHRIVSRLPESEVKKEIAGSIARLTSELEHPLGFLAWPTGRKQDYNQSACRQLPDHGIEAGFSTEPGVVWVKHLKHPYWRYRLPRMTLPKNLTDVVQYASWIEPAKAMLRETVQRYRRRLRWLARSTVYDLKLALGGKDQYPPVDWSSVRRLIFVCKGNVCRSPYAEYRARLMGMEAVSVGLHARAGSPANDRAIFQAQRRGLDLFSHRSKRPEMLALDEHDLVVGMEPWHIAEFRNQVPNTGYQVTLLALHMRRSRALIMDPYGTDFSTFNQVFEQIDEAVEGVFNRGAPRSASKR